MNASASNSLYAVSQWGKTHVTAARFLITIGHLVLAGSALLLGVLLLPYNAAPLSLLQLLLFGIAGSIALRYPKKKSWSIRKRMEGGFLTCGFFLLLLSGPAMREDKIKGSITPAFALSQNGPAAHEKGQTKVGRFLKKVQQRYADTGLFVKILLLIGVLVGAFLFGIFLVGLICNLSCSGYEVAATLVLIFGGAALLAGLIYFPFRIFESKERAERRRERRFEKQKARFENQQQN